jgi:hypothetical protein
MKLRKLNLAAAAAFSLMTSAAFAQETPTAYFAFVDTSLKTSAPHEFVVGVTDPDVIKRMRNIINGESEREVHVEGKIILSRAAYNEEWPFHMDPKTVALFATEIEHCDATPFEIEDHLDLVGKDGPGGGFLKKFYWCSWTSRLVREVTYPGGYDADANK